jgi:hypothetical protein
VGGLNPPLFFVKPKKQIMKIVKNAKYLATNLMFCGLGNGITVADKTREKNGDYITVAHIDVYRKVSYYDVQISQEQKDTIEYYAKTADPNVSVSQEEKTFRTRPTQEG